MREIGGYIELDTYRLPMLHAEAIALNCGRNALAYLLKARGIKRLWIPRLICDSVTEVCGREGVPYSLYGVGTDFRPAEEIRLREGEWLYFVNFYSQFDNEEIADYVQRHGRVIVDNAQSYFQMPLPGVDTLYTCRKYFGVPDGAFLYTDAVLDGELPRDESYDRMRFLLGRVERPASEFYREYVSNNALFAAEPIKRMSKLTENLLHGVDYAAAEKRRSENFSALHRRLGGMNGLRLKPGSFMYPLLVENGEAIRKKLQAEKIYVPLLWPSVLSSASPEDPACRLARDVLPLPIDQRYGAEEMEYMAQRVCAWLEDR